MLPATRDPMLRANILGEVRRAVHGHRARRGSDRGRLPRRSRSPPESAHRTRSIAANVRGGTLVHEGRIDEGLADYELARKLGAGDDRDALLRYHVNTLRHAATCSGGSRNRSTSPRQGFELARSAGVERTSGAILTVNTVDPLFALGEWASRREPDRRTRSN